MSNLNEVDFYSFVNRDIFDKLFKSLNKCRAFLSSGSAPEVDLVTFYRYLGGAALNYYDRNCGDAIVRVSRPLNSSISFCLKLFVDSPRLCDEVYTDVDVKFKLPIVTEKDISSKKFYVGFSYTETEGVTAVWVDTALLLRSGKEYNIMHITLYKDEFFVAADYYGGYTITFRAPKTGIASVGDAVEFVDKEYKSVAGTYVTLANPGEIFLGLLRFLKSFVDGFYSFCENDLPRSVTLFALFP